MKTNHFKNMLAAVVALFITTLALPFTAQAQTYYDFKIAGTQVTSANCTDLTVIKGVTGKADYNPDTQTLTLENATINADDEYGLRNNIKGLTIHLVGNNTITSEQKNGIFNWYDRSLTFTGNGKLTVKGAMSGKKMHQSGISNNGTITVKNCHLQAEGGVYGLDGGQWIFDNCTVRAKGGDSSNPDASSISTLRDKTPEFKNCSITSPEGVVWKKDEFAVSTYFTLVTADGKPVTDWVEITPAIGYDLTIAGTQVNSLNCNDLSVIDGVEGTAKYDPDTKLLTLENAKITNNAEENNNGSGVGLINKIDGLTINLVGDNTITSEKSVGIWNMHDNSLTGNGKLTVKGTTTGQEGFQKGIFNWGTLTVKDCTLEVEAGVCGLTDGHWIFDHCTVRAKGGGSNEDPNEGSICWMWEKQPEFKGCSITTPEGAKWKEWKSGSKTYFTLVTADDKAVTDWVEITPATQYDLKIAGTQVNSLNCNDLSVIEGVEGTAKYDPDTKTLTLEGVTITNNAAPDYSDSGVGLVNKIDGLTINLVGNNTITSKLSNGIWNQPHSTLTFIGKGKLTVKGATTGQKIDQESILNNGTITVKDCTLEAEAGVGGLADGYWIFDHCTVRAKGGGSTEYPYVGSIGWMWDKQPEFKGCSITTPEGAVWKEWKNGEETYFTLFTKDDKAVTDWVTIAPIPTAIDNVTIDNAAQHGIYTLTGIRLKGDFQRLPAGVYIVNGRKVVKH